MKYNEFYARLILLTQLNNLTHVEIADCIGIKKGAIFSRATRNSKMKQEEVDLVEKKFNVDLSSIVISNNSLKRQFDQKLSQKTENLGERINLLQEKNNLSDIQMAALLSISDKEYLSIKNSKTILSSQILFNLKQNFDISVDWLLFGE